VQALVMRARHRVMTTPVQTVLPHIGTVKPAACFIGFREGRCWRAALPSALEATLAAEWNTRIRLLGRTQNLTLLSHWSSGRRPPPFLRRASALRMVVRRSRNVRRLRRRRSRRLVARLASSLKRLPTSCFRSTARNSSATAAAIRNVVCSIMTSVRSQRDLYPVFMQRPGQIEKRGD
jgi:hypothetical protein